MCLVGICFEVGEGAKNATTLSELCSKLEIWYVSTQTYVISENIPYSTKTPLILLMSEFFFKS